MAILLIISQPSGSTVLVEPEKDLNSEATMEIDNFENSSTNAAKMDDSPMEIDAPDMSNSGSTLMTVHSRAF